MPEGQSGSGGRFSFENEMVRRLEEVTTQLNALATRVESTYVRFDLFEASKQLQETERQGLLARIQKLEDRSEWLVRTVGGLVISAIVGIVVVSSKAGLGG
jgi:hypothetical protein